MKSSHTPATAARAIRALMETRIAKTWPEYFAEDRSNLNSYTAAKMVQEQCNGIDRAAGRVADSPVTFREASEAVAEAMPELFAEYWDALPRQSPAYPSALNRAGWGGVA